MSEPCDYCDTVDEGARLGLFALMTGISEDFYCAGWMSGMEYDLWRVEPGTSYGMGQITERVATLLRLLSEEAGGWWAYESGVGPKFLRTEAWLERLKLKESN